MARPSFEAVNVKSANSLNEHLIGISEDARSTCVKDLMERPLNAKAFKRTTFREIVYFTLSILTLGVYALLCRWLPLKSFKLRHVKCAAKDADCFMLKTERTDGRKHQRISQALHARICLDAMSCSVTNDESARQSHVVMFVFRCKRFILTESGPFVEVYYDSSLPYDKIHALGCGLADPEISAQRRSVYGTCSVEVKLTPVLTLLITELLHPFYIFQIFAFALWTWDEYYYYATSILIISIIFTVIELLETMSNERRLHALAKSSCSVNLFLKGGLVTRHMSLQIANAEEESMAMGVENRLAADKVWQVSSTDLVPGHVFEVERDMILPCDCILLSGTVIVNESMLTGESAPVLKTPLPRSSSLGCERYDMKYNASSTIYAGTCVIAAKRSDVTNLRVLALVVRTGFSTLQGSMMRSILHPAPNKFTFYRDSFRFLGVLFIISIFGGIASVMISLRDGISTKETIVRCLDLVTVLVPPALPAAMSAGAAITVGKLLRKWHIMCILPSRINISGQVNTVVFDKTGTLTESDLELVGVVPVDSDESVETELQTEKHSSIVTSSEESVHGIQLVQSLVTSPAAVPDLFTQAIATCNSLSLVDGDLIGEPLEKLMVQFSCWSLHDESTNVSPVSEGGGVGRKDSNVETKSTRCSPSENLSEGRINVKREKAPLLSDNYAAEPKLCSPSDTTQAKDVLDSASTCSAAEGELRTASMAQLAAALRRIYDCDTAVPVTLRPPGSPGCLAVLLRRGASLDQLASGAQNAVQFASSDIGGTIELGIVKRFDFAAELQCMSVIVRDPFTQELRVFCKGSPEKVFEMSTPESVPKNANQILEIYTRKGMRVIGFGWKPIGACNAAAVKDIDRDTTECDLQFLGLMVFANQLKAQTQQTIGALRDAGCFCLMATGDNSLTAVAISRESGILDNCRTIISGDVPSQSAACEEFSSIMWTKYDALGQIPSETSPDLRRFIKGVDHRDISFVVSGKAFRQLRKLHNESTAHQPKPSKSSLKCLPHRMRRGSKEPLSVVVRTMSYGSVVAEPNPWMMLSFHVSRKDTAIAAAQPKANNIMEKALNIEMTSLVPVSVNISLFEFVLRHVVVYSRMSPDDKESLVLSLQSLDTLVAMCGDGANDVAALKAADIGISLSDAEASIAAPFTSTTKSVRSCLDVLREGRAALLSAFQIFKFISLYSIIQFVSMTSLYWFGNNFTDQQFVWTDIFQVLPLSVLISWTDAANKLTPRLPTGSLISPPVMISLFGQVFIQSCFNILICFMLPLQPWYVPFVADAATGLGKGDELACHANTAVFLLTNLQYPIVCLAISQNRPWRRSILTNLPLVVWMAFLLTVGFIFIFTHVDDQGLFGWVYRLLHLIDIPESFRFTILGFVLTNFVCSVVYEYIVASWVVRWYERRALRNHCIYALPMPRDRKFAVEFSG